MNRILIFLFLWFSSSFHGELSANNGSGKILFYTSGSFKAIQQIAQEKNKPIFLDFHAQWCIPCRNMDQKVFTDPKVAEFMNNNFINYKVDIEKNNGPMLSLALGIEKIPGLVILHPDGTIMQIHDSVLGKEKFLKWVEKGKNTFIKNNNITKSPQKHLITYTRQYCNLFPYKRKEKIIHEKDFVIF